MNFELSFWSLVNVFDREHAGQSYLLSYSPKSSYCGIAIGEITALTRIGLEK